MTLLTALLASMWVATLWLAYRWGRHVENPEFWKDEPKARVAETHDEDPRI